MHLGKHNRIKITEIHNIFQPLMRLISIHYVTIKSKLLVQYMIPLLRKMTLFLHLKL